MKLFFIFLFTYSSLVAQNDQEPINLKPSKSNFDKIMQIEKPVSRQIDSLIQLSISYSYTSKDTSILIGEKSVELSRKHEDQSKYALALLELGDTYRIFGEIPKGDSLIKLGKEVYISLNNEAQVAYANNKLGALYQNLGKYEEALEYYTSALTTYENLKDTSNMINPCINIGLVLMRLDNLKKAESYNKKALAWAEEFKAERSKGYIFNNQAINYKKFSDSYLRRIDESPADSIMLKDSADFYLTLSLQNHEGALAVAKNLEDKFSELRIMVNIINIKNTFGEYDEALEIGKKAEELSKNLQSPVLVILLKRYLAHAYYKTGQLNRSLKYAQESHDLAKTNNMEQYVIETHKQLHQTYKMLGMLDKALFHIEALNAFNVRDGKLNQNKAFAEVEAKYQNVKKEKQILEQENEILSLQQQNIKTQKQRNLILGGAALIALFSFFGIRLNKLKKDRNDKKAFAEALIMAQEAERKRIARDLHDGVGQSLLIIKKQLESNHAVTVENKSLIQDTLQEVRSISHDLHPFQLEKFGLTSAIMDSIKKVETASDIFISNEIDNIDGLFNEKAEINIYRTIQEALSNIIKHSKASAAKVSIQRNENQISISIMDNGVGFDHEQKLAKSKSLGLKTMYERIVSIGGTFNISKGKQEGMVIQMNVPV